MRIMVHLDKATGAPPDRYAQAGVSSRPTYQGCDGVLMVRPGLGISGPE
jgi:hypothetical protein